MKRVIIRIRTPGRPSSVSMIMMIIESIRLTSDLFQVHKDASPVTSR